VEVARHLEPYRQGDAVPKTRSFEEREAPLQALEHGDLLTQTGQEGNMILIRIPTSGSVCTLRVTAICEWSLRPPQPPWPGPPTKQTNPQSTSTRASGDHEPLLPVDELANGVELAGVRRGVDDHVEQDLPHGFERPTPEKPLGPPGWGGIKPQ
jgi:predicted component of type VI protein secretion system